MNPFLQHAARFAVAIGAFLLCLGMEWTFHFWRRFRASPLDAIFDAANFSVETLRRGHFRILGSVASAAITLYAGLALLYLSWGAADENAISARWGALDHAKWARLSLWAGIGIAIWLIAAFWLSERMAHPLLPGYLARMLGTCFRVIAIPAAIWAALRGAANFNHSPAGGVGAAILIFIVFKSIWSNGLGNLSEDSNPRDSNEFDEAGLYPFSYLFLSAALLLGAYFMLVATPLK